MDVRSLCARAGRSLNRLITRAPILLVLAVTGFGTVTAGGAAKRSDRD
jgi:hypothetical protein